MTVRPPGFSRRGGRPRPYLISPKTNGFVERFNRTVLDEFFRVKMRETFYETVEALQADLDAWLVHYNTERPHLGYRNQGRRPIETVMSFVS
ncbi:integrase-like protein [Albidovulum inexpectatum]|uniref:Integrase-like protein n=1 Tax=Albidovulum inexpectatum TaxID=196587 RepID=A0A2S5JFU2_9RHOB|nr:integrase-like protein [Albidovulum inexpectatum]